MIRAVSLMLASFGVALCALAGAGAELRAQGNCEQCHLPPGCRGNGNQNGNGNGNGNGNRNRNCQTLTITIESDLDFGRVVLLGEGDGRIMLDLSNGQITTFGDVDGLGGMPFTGRAVITGAPFEEVMVDLPNEISMRDPNGGDARLNDFVTDLEGFPRLDVDGRLEFNFSGTIVIDANTDASGNLRGRIPISVEYP